MQMIYLVPGNGCLNTPSSTIWGCGTTNVKLSSHHGLNVIEQKRVTMMVVDSRSRAKQLTDDLISVRWGSPNGTANRLHGDYMAIIWQGLVATGGFSSGGSRSLVRAPRPVRLRS